MVLKNGGRKIWRGLEENGGIICATPPYGLAAKPENREGGSTRGPPAAAPYGHTHCGILLREQMDTLGMIIAWSYPTHTIPHIPYVITVQSSPDAMHPAPVWPTHQYPPGARRCVKRADCIGRGAKWPAGLLSRQPCEPGVAAGVTPHCLGVHLALQLAPARVN